MRNNIETDHLKLIPCDQEILEVALAGNEALARHLDIIVPEKWTEFGSRALKYALDKLKSGANANGWWTYFPVHKADNKLIGTCGYKGPPNDKGVVEIGYEIIASYRNKGFATELVKGLVNNAFGFDKVSLVQAHTLGEINASTKVLSKCGFNKKEEIIDDEDGVIWKWERERT